VKTHTNRRTENKNGRPPSGIVSNGGSKNNNASSNGGAGGVKSAAGDEGNRFLNNDKMNESGVLVASSNTSRKYLGGNDGSSSLIDSGSLVGTAVASSKFAEHVAELHVDNDAGFERQFRDLQNFSEQLEHSTDLALHPENKDKNRYQNVVACELLLKHSTVDQ
jgi:hypothetical protein